MGMGLIGGAGLTDSGTDRVADSDGWSWAGVVGSCVGWRGRLHGLMFTRKEKTEFVFIRNYIGQSLP